MAQSHSAIPFPRSGPTHHAHAQIREDTSPTRPSHGHVSGPASPAIQSLWEGTNATSPNRDETDYDNDYAQLFGSPTPTQMQSPQQAPKSTLALSAPAQQGGHGSGTVPQAQAHHHHHHHHSATVVTAAAAAALNNSPAAPASPNPNAHRDRDAASRAGHTPERDRDRPSQPHTPLTPPLTPASSASASADNGAGNASGVSLMNTNTNTSTPLSALSLSLSMNTNSSGGMGANTPTTSPFTLAVPPCTPASPLVYRDRGGAEHLAQRWSAAKQQRLTLDFATDVDFGTMLSAAACGGASSPKVGSSGGGGAGAGQTMLPGSPDLTSSSFGSVGNESGSGSFDLRRLSVDLVDLGVGVGGDEGARGPGSPSVRGGGSGSARRGTSFERIGNAGFEDGARFLLVSNIPNDTPNQTVREVFKTTCGELRGMCSRFLGSHGVVILAFFDPRHVVQAEARLRSGQTTQTLLGSTLSSALGIQRVGSIQLAKLLGDSQFISETEGTFLVTSEGKLAAEAIQSVLNGLGELRSFSHANLPNKQAYVVEYFDSRKAKQARDSLDNRSIFGDNLRVIPRHAIDGILAPAFGDLDAATHSASTQAAVTSSMSPMSGRSSQPASPLASFPLPQFIADQQQGHYHPDAYAEECAEIDTTNSSPFHGSRALPISPVRAHGLHSAHHHHQMRGGASSGAVDAHSMHAGGARRISTGSVKLAHLPGLHQSTSDQDLRRRAAAGAVAASSSGGYSERTLLEALGIDGTLGGSAAGRMDPHLRRTSDTFDFESLRRTEALRGGAEPTSSSSPVSTGLGMGLQLRHGLATGISLGRSRGEGDERGRGDGRGHGLRPLRARAISESSASPRVVSPGDDVPNIHPILTRERVFGTGHLQREDDGEAFNAQEAFEDFSNDAGDQQRHQYGAGGVAPSTPDGSAGRDLFERSEEIDLTRIHARYGSAADSSPQTGPQSPHTPHTPAEALSTSLFGHMHSPYGVWQGDQQHQQQQQAYSPAHVHSPHSLSPMHALGNHMGMLNYPPQTDAHTHALLQAHLMGHGVHYYGAHAAAATDISVGGSAEPYSPVAPPRLADAYGHSHHGYAARSPGGFSPTSSSGGRSSTLHRHGQLTHRANMGVNNGGNAQDGQMAERNQIDLDRIEKGLDTRTTVMIKNIPNKLTDKDLIEYISKVCPRKIDFLYLRMDFQNGCNVGYAFVNFIRVEDLLHFAQTKLGVKWNMFSSEKVLQMSYANYQGKEALVEKFKNSCVMDEREAWRPKIFYSSGPRIGLPEPFPAPTHLRRKERSSQNRGALFVPGSPGGSGAREASGASAGSGLMEGGLLPRGPPLRRPNQHPQNLARHDRY